MEEGGGLIQFGGDALQTCEEDDHEVAEVFPHGDERKSQFSAISHYRNGRGVLTTPRRSQGDHHG